MNRTLGWILGVLGVLGSLSVSGAQPYKCDWSVNGIGGGEMSSSAYKCGATAGQTAAGFITASNYWALIGYWLPEGQVGVREQAHWPNQGPLVTRLYAPQPNPFARGTMIHYSLAGAGPVSVQVFDPAGRATRTLAAGVQKPGRYSLLWNGRDNAGQPLGNGAYFCRFVAGDHQQTEKLLLVR